MKKIFSLALVALLFAACGSNSEQNAQQTPPDHDALIDSITAIEETVDNSLLFSADTAEMMVNLYSRFVQYFPEDDLTPSYMMRMAEIEVNRGNLDKGVAIYDSIIANYTPGGFDGYADCMLRKAEALDQDGEHGEKAIEAYHAFVEQFPDHPMAKDIAKRLKFSKMSQDELLSAVHEMEKKNK